MAPPINKRKRAVPSAKGMPVYVKDISDQDQKATIEMLNKMELPKPEVVEQPRAVRKPRVPVRGIQKTEQVEVVAPVVTRPTVRKTRVPSARVAVRTNEVVMELINRRRHQILVHSAIYYRLNSNIVADHIFDAWSKELVALQLEYPTESERTSLHREFEGFDGSTGAFLPYHDHRTMAKAQSLLEYHNRLKKGG